MKESLVKIIRNESLGYYSWDTSEENINSGQGISEWNQADLMTELNTDYIDTSKTSKTTYWYNGKNNQKTGSYNYANNIKNDYISKIERIRWWLGNGSSSSNSAKIFYFQERENNHKNNPSDGVLRQNYWDGKIGLMYPSDYGYASTNASCRNNLMSQTDGIYNCKNNNWLFNDNEKTQWTITSDKSFNNVSFYANIAGRIISYYNENTYGVRPTLYLKLSTKITSGSGTETSPFIIE